MMSLQDEIKDLIASSKEGEYWDFKLKHHDNPVDLVKDITCLANTMRHQGARYLVVGVHPTTYAVTGVGNTTPRRTQADIITTLRSSNFASAQFPDIRLETIDVAGTQIDVIIIADTPHKPYYLETDYSRQGSTMRAGVVYARTQDANTPADRVATPLDVEKMWRERFGLDTTPLDRLRNYLFDFDGWEQLSENDWHYRQFPEFTFCATDEETREVQGGENWVRAAINPVAYVRPMVAKYHQTVIAKVTCIYYDEMRGLIPAAHPTFVRAFSNEWFYSFSADNLDFMFLQFLTRKTSADLLRNDIQGGRGVPLPIVVFASDEEKHAFLEHLRQNPVLVLPQHEFELHSAQDARVSDQDRQILTFSNAVIERFNDWRNSTQTGDLSDSPSKGELV